MSPLPTQFRFATLLDASNPAALSWRLKRNCSLTPAQLARFYVSLCILSLGIAAFFWSMGATLVMPFAWLELAAVGTALVVYARHAGDAEKITLDQGRLVVELESAGITTRAEFNSQWVRIEPHTSNGSLIEVSGQGKSVRIGRYVRPEFRPVLAREIRAAVRGGNTRNA